MQNKKMVNNNLYKNSHKIYYTKDIKKNGSGYTGKLSFYTNKNSRIYDEKVKGKSNTEVNSKFNNTVSMYKKNWDGLQFIEKK